MRAGKSSTGNATSPKRTRRKPASSNVLDYPGGMSQYEKESLAAEAKLAAETKIKKYPPK
jgi:hypothetical protein